MGNTVEHDREQTTRTIGRYKLYGKILGALGIIFNTIGIALFIAYGAKTLDILFNIIFWMFGNSYVFVCLCRTNTKLNSFFFEQMKQFYSIISVITLIMCVLWLIGVAKVSKLGTNLFFFIKKIILKSNILSHRIYQCY